MGAVLEIYARAAGLARAVPGVVLLVFAAELLQHIVEIRLGMYASGLAEDGERTRLLFGLVKVLAVLAALIFALRWWRFDRDSRRAARPTLALFKGLAILILVQVAAEILLVLLGRLAIGALGIADPGTRVALTVGPLLLWLFVATLLYPWYVGLLTEDGAMTLRRSAAGVRGRMWASFGLLLAGILPAMALHYALGYGAEGRSAALVWALMVLDSGVVAFLALAMASTYFTLYRRAAARAPA